MKAKKPQGKIKIGIFSASSPISATVPVRYLRGKAYLESKGFQVVDGSLFGRQDFTAPAPSAGGQRSSTSFCTGRIFQS